MRINVPLTLQTLVLRVSTTPGRLKLNVRRSLRHRRLNFFPFPFWEKRKDKDHQNRSPRYDPLISEDLNTSPYLHYDSRDISGTRDRGRSRSFSRPLEGQYPSDTRGPKDGFFFTSLTSRLSSSSSLSSSSDTWSLKPTYL